MDNAVMNLRTADGNCPTYIAHPKGNGPWPAVIVLMDAPGIRPALYEITNKIAAAGYYAILPDLYYRVGFYEPNVARELWNNPSAKEKWMKTYFSSVTQENVLRDMEAILAFLSSLPVVTQPKVGIVGYCMGGTYALLSAGTFPTRIAVAASFHGGGLATSAPNSPHLLASKMKGRIYVGAAVEDPSFPDDMKARLEEALTKAHVDHAIETYPGAKHGWVPSDTVAHNPDAAARHWQVLLPLLQKTLK